jgi:NAD(P)-dependent dehydrogenase (short-subunit alcohol dehydrogenase family)
MGFWVHDDMNEELMSDPLNFKNKVVFVAGGSSGINLGIAHGFAAHGAKVAIASRSLDRVNGALDELASHGGEVFGQAADVRRYEEIAAVLRAARDKLGTIDVLVSGAAGNFVAPALGMSANGFKTVVEIDLIGTFNVLRAAHEHLTAPGASIVNVSAPEGVLPYRM